MQIEGMIKNPITRIIQSTTIAEARGIEEESP